MPNIKKRRIKSKKPPAHLNGGFKTTLNIDEAIANNYIGEIVIHPKKIAAAVGLFFGSRYNSFVLYYYGTPDERLKKLFGYN